jgi:hypothetical protein
MRMLALLVILLFPMQGSAQSLQPPRGSDSKRADKDPPVPKQYLPPRGMCRIWVDNVPANRQPAPTDCANAIRNRPPNARVLFGPDKDSKAAPKGRARPDTVKRKPPG